MAATIARGKKKNGKLKFKQKFKPANEYDEGQFQPEKLEELMTKEDQELLKNVNDTDDEHYEDIGGSDGDDIESSEIASFIKKLGIEKYKSYQLTSDDNPKDLDEDENMKSRGVIQEHEMEKTEKRKNKSSKNKSSNTQGASTIKSDTNLNSRGKKQKSVDAVNGERDADLQAKITDGSDETSKKKKTDPKALEAALSFLKPYKSRKFLLIKIGEAWRDDQKYPPTKEPADAELVSEAEVLASRLLQDEIALYSKQRQNVKRSEAQWLKTVLSSGTLTDKMAALTLLVQEAPLHNMSSIDTLINMAGKKGRREALSSVDTLRDLFLTGLLPDDCKLRPFNQVPLLELQKLSSGNIDSRDKFLLYWYFENLLKKKYGQFTKILRELSYDTLQATKEKAMSTIYHLLSNKPEQEHVLLPMLVNKLGDQNIKSKASHWLSKLVDDHPNMKGVIVREIKQLLYRPNVSQRAQYYAICYLTQLCLSQSESELATQLIQIYFSFFQTSLKKREIDSKILSALLTGVNRAFVYASDKKEEILSSLDDVYKIIPSVNFHTSVQALMLLFHATDDNTNISDRFYTTLYRKLADPALRSLSKQAIFLSLLFKSLKRDSMNKRIMAFIKRILQVYAHHPPHILCGTLILLSQIIKEKPSLLTITQKAATTWEGDEKDEEKFVDLPIPEEFLEIGDQAKEQYKQETEDDLPVEDPTSFKKSSWLHRSNKLGKDSGNFYNPHHRNPLYSRAELDCVWELEELAKHFHPTVSLYANMMLQGDFIQYDGDPLNDFTLIRFLDKFVYKNPKKIINMKNAGAPKRLSTLKVEDIPVNSREFIDQGEVNVSENEKFFYKYFLEKSKKKTEKDKDSDDGSVSDAEFDKYLDKYGDALYDDLGDLDMDFAGDKSRSKKGGQKKDSSDSEVESDDDDDLDLEDDDLAAEFEKELEGLEDGSDDGRGGPDGYNSSNMGDRDFEEEEFNFEADENDPLSMMMKVPENDKGKKKRKHDDDFTGFSMKKAKKKKLDSSDLFASAEEFAHLLEEDIEGGHVSTGGSNQMKNEDKAAKKQMMWEERRDQWVNNTKPRPKKNWKGKGKKQNASASSYSKKARKFGKRKK